MNVSSAIVYINGNFDWVLEELNRIEGCELHISDEKKALAIISIEAKDISGEMRILEQVNAISGVLEARMHYSYSEDELERARETLSDKISPILDDEIPLEEVRYSGSVYNQMHKA